MYNFNLNNLSENNLNDQVNMLLSIKSLLPRYLNSIPDSEFICICNFLDKRGRSIKKENDKKPLFVETGCGASTLAFAFFAYKFQGVSYTWDSNILKVSEIRKAIYETIGIQLKINLDLFWKPVQHLSNSRTVGINIFKEMNMQIDLYMHDSEHTQRTLLSELELVLNNSSKVFDVLIDDAHYRYKNYDYAYSNLMRSKLGLKPCNPPLNEIGDTLKESAINLFNSKNINFDELAIYPKEIFEKHKDKNHLSKNNKIINVTGNKDDLSSLSSDRFAAFTIKK